MLRLRQPSSLQLRGREPGGTGDSGFCGAAGPGRVQSSTPAQGAAGTGGRNRSGVSAYGMPRKQWTALPSKARVVPPAVPLRLVAGFMIDTLRRPHG